MGRPVQFNWFAVDTDYICLAQTLGAAGALVINGVGLDTANTSYGLRQVVFAGFARTVSLTSTGNLSGINFTITGVDLTNTTVAETIAGPNNTTVYTTQTFHRVTSVTADAAVATAVQIGAGDSGISNWVTLDRMVAPVQVTILTTVTGTVSYSVQTALDDPNITSPSTATYTNLNNATGGVQASYDYVGYGARVAVNTGTTGTIKAVFHQGSYS